jgi:hypothetical protein
MQQSFSFDVDLIIVVTYILEKVRRLRTPNIVHKLQ